jgi:hypothetical protein
MSTNQKLKIMKHLFTSLLVGSLFISSVFAGTKKPESEPVRAEVYAQVSELEKGLYEVYIVNSNTPFKISIADEEGIVIFSKTYQTQEKFVHQFDLRKIGIEDLTLTITGNKTLISEKL